MRRILTLILLCASWALAITTSEVRKVSTPAEFEGYEYGAVTVRHNGMFYRFYCSFGHNSIPFAQGANHYLTGWDYIRMRTSRDGATWSSPRVVLVPSSNVDSCACDPTIIKGDDDFWYLYYTGFKYGYSTETFVARSKNIEGPYVERYVGLKSNKDAWDTFPKEPVPVLTTLKPVYKPDSSGAYGVGQASIVKKEGKYHFWFTDVYKAPSDSINDVAKYWKFVHVVASKDSLEFFKNLQNLKRTPLTFDGKKDTLYPINDFGDVKWNPFIGKYEMWITNRHYTVSYSWTTEDQNVVYKNKTYHHIKKADFYQYIKRYVSTDGNAWYSTGDSLGPYHIVSNVGMSGDENGHIIDSRTMVTFAASKDSLLFELDSISNNDTLFIRPGTVITKRETEGSAYGRPWSTYQFTVGSNVIKGETVLNSANTRYTNGMRYYQFPDSLKNRNLEFISGDYDGDGITDMAVVDRSTAKWYIRSSLTGQFGIPKIPWGWQWPGLGSVSDDFKILVGDFNGDGKVDPAIVHMPTRQWFIYSSKLGEEIVQRKTVKGKDTTYTSIWAPFWVFPSQGKMTHALAGDYDGDGINDIGAVDCYDAAKPKPFCVWRYLSSVHGEVKTVPISRNPSGPDGGIWVGMTSYHTVLEGDYDGDGKTDPTIWDPIMGWFTISSRTGNALYDPYLILLDGYERQIYDLVSPSGSSKRVVLDTIGNEKVKWYKSYGYQFKSISTVFAYSWAGSNFKPLSGDFNGNGTSDMTMVDVTDTDNSGYFTLFTIVTPPISPSYFGHALKYFKKIANPQFFVGDFDGDGVSDCAMGDAANARVYFYTSSFKDKPIEKTISPLYNPYIGALYKAQFIPDEPIVPEEKIQSVPKTLAKFRTKGLDLMISDMNLGSEIGVYNTIGQRIFRGNAVSSDMKVQLPSKGMYVVRVGAQSSVINVK